MKRNNCIQNIKNQINAKINAHTKSQRDYIVFRPKSYLFNPILSRQNNNMTSIFELENKRKTQIFFSKIRCKTKQMEQKSIQIDDHLHIQRCKTFKKLKMSKQALKSKLSPFKTNTPRDNTSEDTIDYSFSKKNMRSSRTEKKCKINIFSGTQKKKKFDSILLSPKINNLSHDEKENILNSMNINRLKPTHGQMDLFESIPLNLMHQKALEKQKLRILKKQRQTHKRLQTQIPAIFLINFPEQKHKVQLKPCDSFIKQRKKNQKEQTYVFRPWQTTQVFQKQQEFYQFLKTR